MRISARSLGQTTAPNPNACQYSLPGVNPIPGLAICNPNTGLPEGATSVQQVPCSGIEPGASGYEECMANAEQTDESMGYNPFVEGQNLLTMAPLTQSQLALQSAQAAGQPLSSSQISVLQPATSGPSSLVSPPAKIVSSGGQTVVVPNTQVPVQPVPPGTPGTTSATASTGSTVPTLASTGCFQLFGGSEPCWGPIGQYTALVGIAAIVGLFLLMRK